MGEQRSLGSNLIIVSSEAVKKIRQMMQAAQSQKKSYADKKRKALEFQVGDEVLLKVAAIKGAMRFGNKGKLSPMFYWTI